MKELSIKVLFALFLITGLKISAQVNTLYYMPGVPQTYFLNPASQPQCDVFIGIPIASSWYLEAYNSSLGLSDFFWNDPVSGNVIHPLHPDANMDEFIEKFDNENYLSSDIGINLLAFGFRVRKMYFTFDITSRTKERFKYPDELIDFALNGNTNDETYDFSALGLDFTEHIEYGIGISRKFGNQVTVGIRPKILTGITAMIWSDSDITLHTTDEEWVLNSNLDINLCTPGITIPTDENGIIDFDRDFEFDSTISTFNDYKKLATGNLGFGIDLGVHFNPMDELQISASVIDLGYIKWKKYTNTISLNGSYSYIGAELNPEDTAFIFDLIDTISSNLELSSSAGSFKTTLDPKIFLSARYSLVPEFDLGFVHRFGFPEGDFRYTLTLLANYRPTNIFSLTGSYSPIGGNARSFGLGISMHLGPINIYFTSDYLTTQYNLVDQVVLLDGINKYTFRYGVNLVFGCNERKKLRKDKPMYYSDEY